MSYYHPCAGPSAPKKREFTLLSNSKGQGTLEYILVLVITVALVFGLGMQLITPFNKWASNYFGEYVKCLLETGELPSLGATSGKSTVCNTSFKSFNLADGRPPTGSGRTSENPFQKGDEGGSSGKTSERSDTGSGARGEGGGGRGRSSFANNSGGSGDEGGAAGTPRKGGEIYTGSTGLYTPGSTVISRVNPPKRTRSIGISGLLASQQDKLDKERNRVRKVANDAGSSLREKNMRIQRQVANKKTSAEDQEFSIGDWFRILLILLIIIAILFFLISQANQLAKSWEK